jgi:hypothetical protein
MATFTDKQQKQHRASFIEDWAACPLHANREVDAISREGKRNRQADQAEQNHNS